MTSSVFKKKKKKIMQHSQLNNSSQRSGLGIAGSQLEQEWGGKQKRKTKKRMTRKREGVYVI